MNFTYYALFFYHAKMCYRAKIIYSNDLSAIIVNFIIYVFIIYVYYFFYRVQEYLLLSLSVLYVILFDRAQ